MNFTFCPCSKWPSWLRTALGLYLTSLLLRTEQQLPCCFLHGRAHRQVWILSSSVTGPVQTVTHETLLGLLQPILNPWKWIARLSRKRIPPMCSEEFPQEQNLQRTATVLSAIINNSFSTTLLCFFSWSINPHRLTVIAFYRGWKSHSKWTVETELETRFHLISQHT